jgi:hypothetical protein
MTLLWALTLFSNWQPNHWVVIITRPQRFDNVQEHTHLAMIVQKQSMPSNTACAYPASASMMNNYGKSYHGKEHFGKLSAKLATGCGNPRYPRIECHDSKACTNQETAGGDSKDSPTRAAVSHQHL